MRKFLLAALMLTASVGIGTTTASAQSFTSATACKAAMAWDAAAAKCVQCKTLVTDAGTLKSCMACKGGTAFDITAKKCTKVVVGKSSEKPTLLPTK
jgi:uncharacterized protein (UPF0333 family)